MCLDEAALIERAKNRDSAAFSEIYERHYSAIYRYCLCRVASSPVAEDLASEVFVRFVECIDDFEYRGRPVLAFLYTIARNLVADHHRRRGRAELVQLDEALVNDVDNPEDAANLALNEEILTRALGELTEDQRQVLILRFLEGLDNHTVAQVLDKSYGAVKALQHRGLGALRRIMGR